jgi:hypothetical protein
VRACVRAWHGQALIRSMLVSLSSAAPFSVRMSVLSGVSVLTTVYSLRCTHYDLRHLGDGSHPARDCGAAADRPMDAGRPLPLSPSALCLCLSLSPPLSASLSLCLPLPLPPSPSASLSLRPLPLPLSASASLCLRLSASASASLLCLPASASLPPCLRLWGLKYSSNPG